MILQVVKNHELVGWTHPENIVKLESNLPIGLKTKDWNHHHHHHLPWEPTTFIFWGYDPIFLGLKTFMFHGFGVQR